MSGDEEEGLRKRKMLLEEDDDDKTTKYEEEKSKEAQKSHLPIENAKPIGKPIRVLGKGKGKKSHFEFFEFNGMKYTLEDSVIFMPAEEGKKPYTGIIKDITQGNDGYVSVKGQWFYHPEEAIKINGENWKPCDSRELFYSSHCDYVPAEAVMHKCVVHFVPKDKELPKRKDHPGFIVQKMYDNVERKLWNLGDVDSKDIRKKEIDVLIQKTLQRIGEAVGDGENQMENEKNLIKE
ncbi:hypothetical protein VNO78_13060 [Psophocarpus tetragonolobus]|uniref:BAH domain-containing protein n=1 Tax=Psophocarpus tetragonolobus TaxID=3891 RepID=A0AAN9XPX4_PSOTE